jgi:hypothetical protein
MLVLVALGGLAAACGGGGGGEATPSPEAPTRTAAATRTATTTAQALPTTTPAGASAPTSAPPAGAFTLADAQALLDRVVLTPADLTGEWVVMSDTRDDNAAASQGDPGRQALFDRCGRLLGRTLVNTPREIVPAFLAGQTLSFFSTVSVYATNAGAAECAAQEGQRLQQPGQLARAFGDLFVNPDAVVVQPVQFPTVGQVSFAATLQGEIEAAGTVLNVTVLVVGFLQDNTTAAVGSLRVTAPPVSELQPLASLVAQRIRAATSELGASAR